MKKSLFETLVDIGKKVLNFFRKPITKLIITLIILFFGVLYLVTNYNQISSALKYIQINYFFLFLSFIFVLATVIIGTFTWWLILSWLGYKKDLFGVIKGYTISSLAKYIPGFVWQYASRSIFLQDYHIPVPTIGTAIIVEFILVTSIGGLVSGFSYWIVGQHYLELSKVFDGLILVGMFLMFLVIIFLPTIIIKLIIKRKRSEHQTLITRYYVFAVIINFTGWIFLSLAFSFLAFSIGINNISFSTAIFLHSTNFFIGNLFLPVPNGLIIRETILSYLGRDLVNPQLLILLAILLRMVIFISEAILTVFLYVISKSKKKKKII